MPRRSSRAIRFDTLFAEVGARLPLFEDLPPDTIEQLTASGFGRGLLTASLRSRLRKAGFRDLGHLAGSSPDAITGIRKFGPVRLERLRTFLLGEIARGLPGARAIHAAEATRDRRLGRLRDMPVGSLPLDADAIAALGLAGGSCADLAGRSRDDLLGTGRVTSGDVDRIVAALAGFLGAGRPIAPRPAEDSGDVPAAAVEAIAARRAARLAEQDREWEEAAPVGGRRGGSRTG